jgi:dipeptidyl aminopeptidase/acylaminoacyl peptidase
MAGGTPREVLEGVLDADWSPDGKDLAVIHVVGDQYRLEYPSGFTAVGGTSWSPDASEVWFSATRASGAPHQIRAVSLAGRERLLYELAGNFGLSDVSRRGELLGHQVCGETQTRARGRGATEEAELPAADMSFLSDLSDDGAQILGTDTGEGGSPSFSFYVQKTDGSAPVWLGEGDGQSISPDGRRVLAVLVHPKPEQLIVVPTGAGETRTLEPGPVVRYSRAVWDPTGRRVVFSGSDGNDVERVYLQDADGGPPRAVTTEDVSLPRIGRPVSPDARRVVALGPDGVPALYPLAGGDPVALPGVGENDNPLCWTVDGRELWVARYDETPPRIERVDVASGRARPWNRLGRSAPSGLFGQYRILVTPDGESYAYTFGRQTSELYLISPLQ